MIAQTGVGISVVGCLKCGAINLAYKGPFTLPADGKVPVPLYWTGEPLPVNEI